MERLLRWLGINPRLFRALARAYLLMDLRNPHFGEATNTRAKDLITPLFWVLGQYLLLGFALSLVLLGRVDAFFFAFASLSASMLVIASALIVEFHEVVLNTADLEVLGHQPIPVRTFSAVRLANLLGYLLLMTAALNLFPAIVGLGLRDTVWTWLPAYAGAALIANLVAAGLVLLFYLFAGARQPSEGLRQAVAWTQIILILVIGYGGQAVFRDPQERLEMLAYQRPEWLSYLPSAWLAEFIDSCGPSVAFIAWQVPVIGACLAALIWALALWRLSSAYGRMEPGRTAWQRAELAPLPGPGQLLGAPACWFIRNRSEAAGYWLCATMLARDQELRMRGLPMLGMVLAPLLLGVYLDKLGNPLVCADHSSVLSVTCLYLATMPLTIIFHELNYSRQHAASWILSVAPIAQRAAFVEGIRKAVCLRLMLPLLVLVSAVLALVWRDPLSAVWHLAISWLVVSATAEVAKVLLLKGIPFAQAHARGQSMGPFATLAALISGCAMLLIGLHMWAAGSILTFALYSLALIVLASILRLWSRRAIVVRI